MPDLLFLKYESSNEPGVCWCDNCGTKVLFDTHRCPNCRVKLSDVLVDDLEQVVLNAIQFNKEVKQYSELRGKLSQFKHWYYFAKLDMFAPSKYIGYKQMNIKRYADGDYKTGTDSEIILNNWFKEIGPESEEFKSLFKGLAHFLIMNGKELRKNFVIHVLK